MPFTEAIDKPRQTRGDPEYVLCLFGQEYPVKVTEAFSITLLEVGWRQPGFLDKLHQYRTPRARRPIVSRDPEEIYSHPNNAHLIKGYAYPLENTGWYFHANISANRCRDYLRVIAEYAGLDEIPRLVKCSKVPVARPEN